MVSILLIFCLVLKPHRLTDTTNQIAAIGLLEVKPKQNPMPMAYHVSSSVMSVCSADSNVRTGIWDLFSASKRNVTYKTYKDGSCARVQTTSLS